MHYRKAILFVDKDTADKILAIKPSRAGFVWYTGRLVKNFDGRVWDEHKRKIVIRGNCLKFTSPDAAGIRRQLLDLKDHWLVQCAPNDAIWGIGYSLEEAKTVNAKEKWGQNLLGKILMAVRDRLIEKAGIGEQSGQPGPARPSQPANDNQAADLEGPHDDEKATEHSGLDEVDDHHEYTGTRDYDDIGDEEKQSRSGIHLPEAGDVAMSDSAGPSTLSSVNPFTKHDRGLAPVTRQPQDDNSYIEGSSLGFSSKADIGEDVIGYANDIDMDRFEQVSETREVPDGEEDLVDKEDDLGEAIPPPKFAEQEDDEMDFSPKPKADKEYFYQLPAISSIAEELSAGNAAWQDEQVNVDNEELATATDEDTIPMELAYPTVTTDQREVEQDDVDHQSDLKHENVSKSWTSTIHRMWQRSRVMGGHRPSRNLSDNEEVAATQPADTDIEAQRPHVAV
ncbi:hypothetical protein PG996_006518 [Apiospora saccharicola]|uniref:NADAR domain-containing protein n=1 Tax=Apiospora saccharicola TaxID=335842 RepID=A0ABR1V878_9PEZI